MTVQPEVYSIQSKVAFIASTNSGQNTIIPNNTTRPATSEIRQRQKENKDKFIDYNQANKTLKSQLINVVDEIYTRSMRDKYTGHARVTILQILTHIYDNYARISHSNIKENDFQMNEAWEPN